MPVASRLTRPAALATMSAKFEHGMGQVQMAAAECQVGGRFSRCHSASAHACQYCGRNFCELHTHYAAGHEAVCSREKCAAKHEDLVVHLEYRRRVGQRNGAGLCGLEDCGPHPGFECSLCRGHFCGLHLSERLYPFQDGMVRIDKPVSVCTHCWQRRKIWR